MPTQSYWQGVKKLCEDHGALLIFDEIIEGFGRTGKMFASEDYVTPDALAREEMDCALGILEAAIDDVERGKKY